MGSRLPITFTGGGGKTSNGLNQYSSEPGKTRDWGLGGGGFEWGTVQAVGGKVKTLKKASRETGGGVAGSDSQGIGQLGGPGG